MLVNRKKHLLIVSLFRMNEHPFQDDHSSGIYCTFHSLTKTCDLTFIGCHNFRHEFRLMVVTTSMRAPSFHGDVFACTLTRFVPYTLHKFRLTSSFSYMWM